MMGKDYLLTDEDWKKLQKSGFQAQDFLKNLALWDSIRHIAGDSDFSAEVNRNMQKIKELVEHIFINGSHDNIEELFFESSCMEELMGDMETWILEIHRALKSLNVLKPDSLPEVGSDIAK
jgi:hypothetical protein